MYAFKQYSFDNKPSSTPKAGDLCIQPFSLMNLLSSKMSAAEFAEAGAALFAMGTYPGEIPSFMQLNSTPLNESVIAAMQIVPEFQKRNKLQIVNTVFLTDGEGDSINYVYNDAGCPQTVREWQDYYTRTRNVMVIRDPVTKREVKLTDILSRMQQTQVLVELMKYRTHSNVLGFYIISYSEFKKYGAKFFNNYWEEGDTIRSKFNKEKSIVTENGAFDEYYLMKSDKKTLDDEEELVVKSNTTKGLVSAFNKYNNNKVFNRGVLNRFIGMIS